MLTQQRPTKNIIRKSRDIELFKKSKIISEKMARALNPDYFLVLPWHFKNYIIRKERKFDKNRSKLIFPLPDIDII